MSVSVRNLYDTVRHLAASAGACPSAEFMRRLNNAGEMLIKRIDADGMMFQTRLCLCGGCVVLPSWVRAIRQAWIDGDPVDLRSEWWHGRLGGRGLYGDQHMEIPWQNLVDSGRRAATQRIVCAQKNEVFEVKHYHREDAGAQISIHYIPPKGGVAVFKCQLNENLAPCLSDTGIGEVVRFEKPRTQGPVELWARHLESGHRRLLSMYSSRDEVPEYLIYEVTGRNTGALTIKAKREWAATREMDDIVDFGDAEVWGMALQAESAWSNGDNATKESILQMAIATLAMELRDKRPHAQAQNVQFMTPWSNQNNYRRGSSGRL